MFNLVQIGFFPGDLALIIFIGRVVELCFNSLRIVSVAKGFKRAAFVFSFVEAIIFLLLIASIFKDLSNVANFLAFALGHASGCYLGIIIENKLALGWVMVRIMTQKKTTRLISTLRSSGFRVTEMKAESNYGKIKIIFSFIKRKSLKSFIRYVKDFDEDAFFTVEDIKSSSQVIQSHTDHTLGNTS